MKKRTKIISTIGPASCSSSMINKMIVGGTDVFRINLSHSTIADAKKILNILKNESIKAKRPVASLLDLQGQKIRIGSFSKKKNIHLKSSTKFTLNGSLPLDKGTSKEVGISNKSLA